MRKILYILLLFPLLASAGTYYVTTSGSSGNGGTNDTSDAWSISHAFTTAVAGDTVWIKAGDYVISSALDPSNNGTTGNPIVFIGYVSTTGDVAATDGATVTYADYQANANALDAADMPLIRGSSVELSTTGSKGINLDYASYIELHNLQIQWRERGVSGFLHGAEMKLKNIVVAWTGNFDPVDSWNFEPFPDYFDPDLPAERAGGQSTNQVGRGIDMSSNSAAIDGVIIEDCTVINSGHQGINVGTISSYPKTTGAIIRRCKTYSDQNINPMDYYISIYNSDYSLIEDCESYRLGDLSHQGHGIDLKRTCEYNTIKNCYIFNTWLELNAGGATPGPRYNTFENITIEGNDGIYDHNIRDGGLLFQTDVSFNTFTNLVFKATNGIIFQNSADDGPIEANAGHDNTFINCVFHDAKSNTVWKGTESHITFTNIGTYPETSAYDNTWYNCTFDTGAAIINSERPNSGNEFINCSFSNITAVLETGSTDQLNATFTNCNFGDGTPTPSGAGITVTNGTSVASNYTSQATDDFTLLTGSSLRDAGTTTPYAYDFIGTVRPQNTSFDIGAYEFVVAPAAAETTIFARAKTLWVGTGNGQVYLGTVKIKG